jgi:hypothetical protein
MVEDCPNFTDLEIAMLQLMMLCNDSGAWRGFYDELLSFIRKQSKNGINITKA